MGRKTTTCGHLRSVSGARSNQSALTHGICSLTQGSATTCLSPRNQPRHQHPLTANGLVRVASRNPLPPVECLVRAALATTRQFRRSTQ